MTDSPATFGAQRRSRAATWLRAGLMLFLLVAVPYHVRSAWDIVNGLWRTEAAGPRSPFQPRGYALEVQSVELEAKAGGLAEGDRLIALDGRPYRGIADVADAVVGRKVGDTLTVEFERGGERHTAGIRLERPIRTFGRASGAVLALVLGIVLPFLCLGLGAWVVLVRPRDPLAWIFLGMLASFAQLVNADWVSWEPGFREVAGAYSRLLNQLWPVFMLLFGLAFPIPFEFERRRPWLKWLAVSPLVVSAIPGTIVSLGSLRHEAAVTPLANALVAISGPLVLLFIVSISGFFVALGFKTALIKTPEGRRRLSVLRTGAMFSLTPLGAILLFSKVTGRAVNEFPTWIFATALLMLLLFPVTMAYVIVVQRAMDVRVALRLGARYVIVKNGIRVLIFLGMLPLGLGVAWFFLRGPAAARPLKPVAWAAYIGLAVAVRSRARRVFQSIDRRFFRDAYDEERLLNDLSVDVRMLVEADPLLGTVIDRVTRALHVERIVAFMRKDGRYEAERVSGAANVAAPPLPADPGLTEAFVAARGGPMLVYFDDPESWTRALAPETRACLEAVGAQVLLPLAARGQVLGLLSLGPKRSEQPYSRTDLRLLANVAAQTGLALESSRLAQEMAAETAKRARLSREIEIARDVQQRLFPQEIPAIPGLDVAGTCRPASGVGGDYYDFVALPGGRLGIAVGDVSGKGVPAALHMASLQASLRGQTLDGADDLATLMSRINRLVHDASPINRYATFFYGQYDPARRRLDYVNAGHNAPMLLRADGGPAERLSVGGMVVGLLPENDFSQGSVELGPGDLLAGFTDGISEAMNAADEEWGEAKLEQALRSCKDLPAADVLPRVFAAADAFAAGAPQHDDMTLVVVRVVG